jgi:hypothetical protein
MRHSAGSAEETQEPRGGVDQLRAARAHPRPEPKRRHHGTPIGLPRCRPWRSRMAMDTVPSRPRPTRRCDRPLRRASRRHRARIRHRDRGAAPSSRAASPRTSTRCCPARGTPPRPRESDLAAGSAASFPVSGWRGVVFLDGQTGRQADLPANFQSLQFLPTSQRRPSWVRLAVRGRTALVYAQVTSRPVRHALRVASGAPASGAHPATTGRVPHREQAPRCPGQEEAPSERVNVLVRSARRRRASVAVRRVRPALSERGRRWPGWRGRASRG